ncbi:MAG: Uma2 family endonuclease [Verrucomicrobiales bacterium]|nr:Uma2 family endonuclease [Verrucomicrobiales bacterium]
MGIQRSNETLFYYPDIVVECDSTAVEDDSYTTEPKVIIEVLSPTTERIDRQEKFWAYAETASLEDYVLVDHQESAVTVFRKTTDWQSEALSSTANLVLPSIEFQMPVAQVCIDIHFNNLA